MFSIRSWVAGASDFVWPPRCPVCGRVVEGARETGSLHRACLAVLEPARSIPLRFDVGRAPVHALLADRAEWFALLHRVKYGGEFALVDPLVDAAAAALREGGGVPAPTIFVPVPDDPRRRRARGGSVVARIAGRLAHTLGAGVREDLLRRRRRTASQTTQADDGARERNVRGAFAVSRLAEIPSRTRLVLVDDQATSGATLRALLAVAALRGHACAVLVLARARRTPAILVP